MRSKLGKTGLCWHSVPEAIQPVVAGKARWESMVADHEAGLAARKQTRYIVAKHRERNTD